MEGKGIGIVKIFKLSPDDHGKVDWPLLDAQRRSVVTIGTFDGVHKGHQAVLSTTVELARKHDSFSLVIIFTPRPSFAHLAWKEGRTASEEEDRLALTSLRQREELIARQGVDALFEMEYTPEFAQTTYTAFLGQLVGKVGMRTLVLGEDARLGKDRSGDIKAIRNVAQAVGVFELEVVDDQGETAGTWVPGTVTYQAPQRKGEPANPLAGMSKAQKRAYTKKHHMRPVRDWSSSHVRDCLATGRIAEARSVLGRDPQVAGVVVHGDARGRDLGFPTANVGGYREGFIPVDGVYAGYLLDYDFGDGSASEGAASRQEALSGHPYREFDGRDREPARLPAAISVGLNDTFHEAGEDVSRTIEAYVLGSHDLDLYGHRVAVDFAAFLRPMVRFDSAEELVDQLKEDERRTEELTDGRAGS